MAIENGVHLLNLLKQKKIVKVKQSHSTNYYFYNLRKKYRYLTPQALQTLKLIATHFQQFTKQSNINFKVKFAISSMLRPLTRQQQLKKINANASSISSHSYANSFDIFYDDFFIDIWPSFKSSLASYADLNSLKTRVGFILGDSLRRQLKTILMKTLISLQTEGKLYAIIETNQKCFHISSR